MQSIVYYNAVIYTVNAAFSVEDTLWIEDTIIKAVGKKHELHLPADATYIDCKGAYIYPGFIDPHCHFIDLGKSYFTASLHHCKNIQEVIHVCKQFQQNSTSAWLLGRGWNQNNWDIAQLPDKSVLDECFPDIPVLLVRIDSHVGWLNSKAMEICKLHEFEFDAGQVEYKQGIATGIVYDKALYHVLEYCKPDAITKKKYLEKAEDICFSYGLTSIGDAFVNEEDRSLYLQWNEAFELRMPIYAMLTDDAANLAYYTEKGTYNKNKLHIRALKHFADGALGSRGAALIEPYSDDSTTKGMLIGDDMYWKTRATQCLELGIQMVTHAIGDAANKYIINLYASHLQKNNTLRWRVEHLQILEASDMMLLKEYAIVPSIQSTHGTSDYSWAVTRIGSNRMKKAYRIKDIKDVCGYFVNGSDFPIEKPNPLRGFISSVFRKDDTNLPAHGFAIEQAVSRRDALQSMTIWAAFSQFEEDIKGSIEPGKFANITMVDTDLLQASEFEIRNARVLETIVEGKSMYRISA